MSTCAQVKANMKICNTKTAACVSGPDSLKMTMTATYKLETKFLCNNSKDCMSPARY